MPGGVIDEFLIKVGMEGDPSGLVDAYKQITKSQEGLEKQTQEFEQKDSSADEKKQKRAENMQKFQAGVNTAVGKGVSLAKSGAGMARNWAVALLAVDGAAMAVIGRLSQMAVEYDNLAGSTNMSASELKAWENTMKAARGEAGDVRSSMQAIYEKAFEISQGRGDETTTSAWQALGVQTEEGGALRDTGDIFSDIISGFRKSIEEGMDVNLAIGFLKDAGVSGMLAEPLRREKDGEYVASEKQYEKFLKLAQPMDDLADASIGLSTVITELSATFKEKFTKVLLELIESGVLEDMLTKLTAFVAGIDAEAVAKVISDLIGVLEKLVGWVSFLIPGS
ncbi:MAG: hypothetical protein KAT14_07490, partial [Candidatus Marinimicrobia bacterium]|nr:hypothetical protein [Candidatus Neomarinimicrobiota bacterium]